MKTKAQADAKLSVDTKKLFETLRHAFSNSTTFIGELMQNARRAAANQIAFETREHESRWDLIVTDDGVGISDLTVLLRMAESGWDEETMEKENPYGIGFLSALYACEEIRVESGASFMEAKTEEILAGKAVPILEAGGLRQGTRIQMRRMHVKADAVLGTAANNAMGFPIEVVVNSIRCTRPDAEGGRRQFAETPIGRISILGIHSGKPGLIPSDFIRDSRLYYQGLPIEQARRRRWSENSQAEVTIVHLDEALHRARWPDRKSLYDAETKILGINAELRQVLVQHLHAMRQELTDIEFANRYLDFFVFAPDLFRSLQFIHKELLCNVDDYPHKGQDFTDNCQLNSDLVHLARADVESGRYLLVSLEWEFEPEDNGLGWMASYASKNVLCVRDESKMPTWAKPYIISALDLTVEIRGPWRRTVFIGRHIYVMPVVLCADYRIIESTTGRVLATCTDDAVFVDIEGEGQQLVIPNGETSGAVVTQVVNFFDDDDDLNVDSEREESAMLISKIMDERGRGTEALLKILQESYVKRLMSLRGKTLVLSIGEDGEIAISKQSTR